MGIKITGLDQIQKKLELLKKNLSGSKMKRKLNTIGLKIQNVIEESFENEASPSGKPWKPLSSKSAFGYYGGKKKARIKNGGQKRDFLDTYGAGGSKRILYKEGNLSSNWVTKADSNKVVVSNNSKSDGGFAYGLTHQFGSLKRGIPARPFLPIGTDGALNAKLSEDIVEYLEDEIEKQIDVV